MTDFGEETIEQLRRKAEEVLRRSRSNGEIRTALERLLKVANPGTDTFAFAHRHLAELALEKNPWQAALHLRHALTVTRHDDVLHALMGLAQALLNNYRVAVAAYRKALVISPRNPWYHHNLGHLLDVALDEPEVAEPHLLTAHELEPDQHEITASLAHCVARRGDLVRARTLAQDAVRMAPRNRDHRALLAWVNDGAPQAGGPAITSGAPSLSGPMSLERPAAHAVVKLIEKGLAEAGYSENEVLRAKALWDDFRASNELRILKPAVYAAAVEYAIALVHGVGGATQASIAKKYGVSRGTLASRFGEIRQALALQPGDDRYR